MSDRTRRAGPLLALAALIYLPLLATARGQVVADTKSYLYLDPDRLLSRAWSMWDPHVGMGTVTHQNIGFLWPMGPYYWAMEHLGAPDWVAQRIWLGSIMFAAALGVRYLLRTFAWQGPAVAVAMVAYGLTPYLLTIAPRISAILLPYAALPWLLALTVRALRTGSWRHPAAFALVVATVGTSNATSILLVGVGPALWVLWALATREQPLGPVAAAVGRIGVLSLATNAWWIVGLSVQATNGVDVLRYTESVEVTAAASSAQEVLRGLGYWFFYGDDPIGPWIGPSRPYQSSLWLLAATFAVPVLALAGGAVGRWRQRSFFVLLAAVGLGLAVGVYPYDDPSPFGAGLKAFLHSDVGMAMRSMPRAAPLVVLALAVMLGAGMTALSRRLPRATWPATGLVLAVVVLSLPPLWQRDLAPPNLSRPEAIPGYWEAAGAHLDATDDGTRVLELPGSDFTSYRWGTTIDPVTPGVTDRPMVARELVPQGSAGAWNLLKAFDGRLQAHIAEAATVAPMARAMRAGQLVVRSDLEYEHYDTPRPRDLWRFLLGAPGLEEPVPFGPPGPNEARLPVPMLDELALSLDPSLPDPPPVAVIPVDDALPIVTAKPTAAPVVVAGDGEGLVDLAAARLIRGVELLRYSASMTDDELAAALDAGAALVVTDSNRRRAERWGTVRFTSGYTEPAGLAPLVIDRSDARLPVFPDADDDARTVAVHRGGVTANATSYGGRNEYLPEDRPAGAVDGDPRTAWRTSRDDPVVGERLVLTLDDPVQVDTMTFLAAPEPINRWVTRVALRFDGGDEPVVVSLDERSRTAPGQTVDIGARTFSEVDIEVLADSAGPQGRYGGLTSTGFAEVGIGDVRLDEAVRPPIDLLRRAGDASLDHPLAVVLTRLRSAATDVERLDEERRLVRLLDLPTDRDFALSGTVRLSPRAADHLLDDVLRRGTGGPSISATASTSAMRARQVPAADADRTRSSTGDERGPTQVAALGREPARSVSALPASSRATPFAPQHLSRPAAASSWDARTSEAVAPTQDGTPTIVATSSSRLAGVAARASAAVDGDLETAWVAAYGDQVGQWIEVTSPTPMTVDRLDLALVADGRHSVPTRVRVEADGQPVAVLPVPAVADGPTLGATALVKLSLPAPVTASRLRVVVEEVRRIETTDWGTRRIRTMPVGVAELGVPGLVVAAPSGPFATGCRDDLVSVDGSPVSVEVSGTVEGAVAGEPLALRTCGAAPVTLTAGGHELRAAEGTATGLDVDRLVLRSDAGGAASTATGPLVEPAAAPTTEVLAQGMDHVSLRVTDAEPGQPFWLAFGQGWNDGWEATLDGESLGEPVLVDGFANGWLVDPADETFDIQLRFAPQRRVTIALWASLVAAIVCLALALRRPRPVLAGDPVPRRSTPREPAAETDKDPRQLPQERDDTRTPRVPAAETMQDPRQLPQVGGAAAGDALSAQDGGPPLRLVPALGLAGAMALVALLVATPPVAVAVGTLTVVAALGLVPRWLTAAVAPVAMAASAGYVILTVWRRGTLPGLEWPAELHRAHPIAWLAVLALLVDAVAVAVRGRSRR